MEPWEGINNYENMTLELKLGGKKKTRTALPPKEAKPWETQVMESLYRGEVQCFAVVLSLDGSMEVPTHLPLSIGCDHMIALNDESKLVNVPHKGTHTSKWARLKDK